MTVELPLRAARRRRGLSAHDVAAALDVHPNTVLRWERVQRLPGPAHLKRLAATLCLSTAEVDEMLAPHRTPVAPKAGCPGPGLRALRRSRGISVRQLSSTLGVPVATVYNWEHGRARIPVEQVQQLARLLSWVERDLVDYLRSSAGALLVKHRRPRSALSGIRHRAGFSLAEAARRSGVPRQRLSALESGAPFTRRSDVVRLAHTYRCTAATLLTVHTVEDRIILSPSAWRPGLLPRVLVALRCWNGDTQRGVAAAIGCAGVTVRRWERGTAVPPRRRRRQLEELWQLPEGALSRCLGQS